MNERSVLRTQAAYYALSGVWPIVSPKTFQLVTGPKADMWLVKTFGALVGAVGASLALAEEPQRDTRVLAAGSAAALGIADAWFVARGRIKKTYLIDAAAQAALLAALVTADRGGPENAG